MEIKENIELAKFTSFKIGGGARFFVEVKNQEDLIAALKFAKEKAVPFLILGGGTNMLIRDAGFAGLVIRNQMKNIEMQDDLIVADTALVLPEINNFGYKQGWVGFERLATVPGTLGGALYNNAHHLGTLLSEFVQWVEILDLSIPAEPQVKRIPTSEMQFEYDSSKIKIAGLIALRAALKLQKGDIAESKKNLIAMLKERSEHQPYGTFNSGCMFQNVPNGPGPGYRGTSAGWLIEQCGLKGAKIGEAVISEKHGNFFVNSGKATSADILKLVEMCQNKVKEKFGVNLELEIKII